MILVCKRAIKYGTAAFLLLGTLLYARQQESLILHIPDVCGTPEPRVIKKRVDDAIAATHKQLNKMRRGGLLPALPCMRITYRDDELGFYVLHPAGAFSFEKVRDQLRVACKQQGLCCIVDRDSKIFLAQSAVRSSSLQQPWHLNWLNKSSGGPFSVAHRFTLKQLAPRQGAGATIVLIDTGVAAFEVRNDRRYVRHPDLTMHLPDDGFADLNLIDRRQHETVDELRSLIAEFAPTVPLPESFAQECLQWIKEFWQEDGKTDRLIQFLKTELKSALADGEKLTKRGELLKEKIISCLRGLSVGWLMKPYQHYALLPFLPSVRIQGKMPLATHGTHAFGIVAGQPHAHTAVGGIAPHARVIMIKAFDEQGMSRKSTLIAALKKAAYWSADIVNLSLKIADRIDTTDDSSLVLEHMLGLIPYVVAASGNEGDPKAPGYQGPIESYPARYDSVAFDVGAFGISNQKFTVAPFSQYEPGIGPLFALPGQDIISTDIIADNNPSPCYAARSGTSMAAALMSGLIGLIVAEFKEIFSKQEILTVCYHAAYKPEATNDWQKVVLGAFDARAALLVLRSLAQLKKADHLVNFNETMERLFFLMCQPELINGTTVDEVVDQLVSAVADVRAGVRARPLPARVQRLVQETPLRSDPWIVHAQTKIAAMKINKMQSPSRLVRV